MSNVTIDMHIDVPWRMVKYGLRDLSVLNEKTVCAVDIPRMRSGGLDCPCFALYLSDDMQFEIGDLASDKLIDDQISWINDHEDCWVCRDQREITQTLASNKIPVILGLEGGRLLHHSIERLNDLAKAGLTYLGLVHNRNTNWAQSATDARVGDGGLTRIGKRLVQKANDFGVMIDISHSSDRTALDAITESSIPVIASHSGVRKIQGHPRNLTDELITKVAQSGGIVHVPLAAKFTGPTIEDVALHIDYIAQMVGVDRVGIGSDLDGAQIVQGFLGVEFWKETLSEALNTLGYDDEEIGKILGGNTFALLK